ncbi:hypothetical protein [Ornithinimicrobium kibberense]|uniref:hypothetical protein n=1 Tax=Ornithinimicrobium kibberense TaxID=282060 RepID=UPI0036166A78
MSVTVSRHERTSPSTLGAVHLGSNHASSAAHHPGHLRRLPNPRIRRSRVRATGSLRRGALGHHPQAQDVPDRHRRR